MKIETFTVEVPAGTKRAAMLVCQCALFGDLSGAGQAGDQLKQLVARWEHARTYAMRGPSARQSLMARGLSSKSQHAWRTAAGCDIDSNRGPA